MNERLAAQLAEVERRIKRVRFRRACGYTVIVLLAVFTLGAALDYVAALSMSDRAFLTAACYAAVAAFAWFVWWRPFLRPMKPEDIAWSLETEIPELNEKLISAVEFGGVKDGRISADLTKRVLEEAEVDLLGISPTRVFPFKARYVIVPGILAVIFLVLLGIPRLKFGMLVKRVAFPSYHDAAVGRFGLSVIHPRPGKRVEGESIRFVVQCTDPNVRYAELCVEDHRTRRFVMRYDERAKLFGCTVTDVRRDFTYWACSEAVSSTKHVMRIVKRPRIESFNISYRFPAYTGLQSASVVSTVGDLKAYPGTQVGLVVKASKPLQSMKMIWLGTHRDVPLSKDRTEGRITLGVDASGQYSLHLLDKEGLTSMLEQVFAVTALEDNPPSVTLHRPGNDVYVDSADVVEFAWTAKDDFGVDRQELLCSAGPEEQSVIALEPAARKYSLVLNEPGFIRGDRVECSVRVYDGAGQHTDSSTCNISLTFGSDLQFLGPFLHAAGNLKKSMESIAARLGSVKETAEKIRFARDYPGGAGTADIDHNLNLMCEHQRWLNVQIGGAEREAAALARHCFFPKSRSCSDVTGRYLRQQRLFILPDLVGRHTVEAAVESLETSIELTGKMADALAAKAGEQVPLQRCRRMSEAVTLEYPGGPYDDAMRACMAGMLMQAESIAADYRTLDELAALMSGRLRSTGHGLRGLALELELYDRAEDWLSVGRVARDYATRADENQDPAVRRALRLASRALDTAVTSKDTGQLNRIASVLPDVDEYERLSASSPHSGTNLLNEAEVEAVETPGQKEKELRIAGIALLDIAETDEKKLSAIHDRLETIAGKIREMSGVTEKIRHVEGEALDLIDSLGNVAFQIQRVAEAELSALDGDVEAAGRKMVIAAHLNGSIVSNLVAAGRLLGMPGEGPGKEAKSDRPAPAGRLVQARAGLSVAAENLAGITDLVGRLEAWERNELSEIEKDALAADMRGRVDQSLGERTKKTLGALKRVRELQRNATLLAESARRIEPGTEENRRAALTSLSDAFTTDARDLLQPLSSEATGASESDPALVTPDNTQTEELRAGLGGLKDVLVEIEAANAEADGIHDEIRPHELDAIRALDALPGSLFNAMERERIAETRAALTGGTFEEKARHVDEIRKMVVRKDVDASEKLSKIAGLLRADNSRAVERDRLEGWALGKSEDLIGRVSGLKALRVLNGDSALAVAAALKLDAFSDNIRAGNLERARANIEALEKDVTDLDGSVGATRLQSRSSERTEKGPAAPVNEEMAGFPAEFRERWRAAALDVDAARSALDAGDTGAGVSDHLGNAAGALQGAAAALVDSVIMRMAELLRSQRSSAGMFPGRMAGGTQAADEEHEQGMLVSEIPYRPLGESWEGAGAALTFAGKGGRKIVYDDYYRKATMRYLKKIHMEDRQ